jgi:hypothetical protein
MAKASTGKNAIHSAGQRSAEKRCKRNDADQIIYEVPKKLLSGRGLSSSFIAILRGQDALCAAKARCEHLRYK